VLLFLESISKPFQALYGSLMGGLFNSSPKKNPSSSVEFDYAGIHSE